MNKLPRSPRELGKKEFSLLNPKPKLEKLTLYLFVLLLPTQLSKHFWPTFSQVLGSRIDYLSPTLYLTDILITALFLFWLKRAFSFSPSPFRGGARRASPPASEARQGRRGQGEVQEKGQWTVNVGWLIFFVYLLLISVFSNNPPLSLYGFLKILEMTFLGFYIAKNIKTKKELTTIAIVFAIAVFGESLLAIAQYIHQGSINGLLYFIGERKFASFTPGIANASIDGQLILRPYGSFPHPNVLAGFLLCATVFIFAFLEDNKNKAKKILKTTALLLGSIALLLTLSRIAIILWIFIITLIVSNKIINQLTLRKTCHSERSDSEVEESHTTKLLAGVRSLHSSADSVGMTVSKMSNQFKIKSILKAIGIILLVIIVAISLLNYTPVFPRLEGTSLTEKAIIQRTELIQSSVTIIKTHLFFGVGLYNFLPVLSQIQKPTSQINELQPVHNIFLLFTAETGIIGLIFFIWFLLETYRRLLKYATATHNILLTLVSLILILGQFDHYWLTLQQGQLLFALILGLCWTRLGPTQSSFPRTRESSSLK